MRHDWVFDVLSDMLTYARQNGLPALAAKVAEALEEARREIGAGPGEPDDGAEPGDGGRKMH